MFRWLKLCGPCHLYVRKHMMNLLVELRSWCRRECFPEMVLSCQIGIGISLLRASSLPTRHPAQASASYLILTWPQTHGCVYECFFWKQLLHKLFDRILASSILCTIIFWRKLSLSSFNNCFICWLLWQNWKHGWYWFKNSICLALKLIGITVFHFKRILEVLDDFCLFCDMEPADTSVVLSRLLHMLWRSWGLEHCSYRNCAKSQPW